MKITLNNNPEVIDRNLISVTELLLYKNFTFKMLVIKINGTLVKKEDYHLSQIHDGDEVHVLHLISGG